MTLQDSKSEEILGSPELERHSDADTLEVEVWVGLVSSGPTTRKVRSMSIVSKPRRYRTTNGVNVGGIGLPLPRQRASGTPQRLIINKPNFDIAVSRTEVP